MPEKRAYRFVVTFEVEPGHHVYDDPEWAADAAWGALTNEYGLRAIYTDIEEVQIDQPWDRDYMPFSSSSIALFPM